MSSLDAVLAAGRAASESRMKENIRLYKQVPDTFDRDSGNTVPGAQTVLYEGKARIKPLSGSSPAGDEQQAGERAVLMHDYVAELPYGTELPDGLAPLRGDRLDVVSSDNPRMVGLELWVTGTESSSQVTAWRITAEER